MVKITCQLGSAESPVHYWLVTVPPSSQLASLATDIRRRVENLSSVCVPLHRDDEAIVFYEQGGTWERARVIKACPRRAKLTHLTFLLDRGIIIETEDARLAPHTLFTKTPFAAFEFRLFGLLQPKSREAERYWLYETRSAVKELLSSLVEVDVRLDDNGIYHGDALFERNGRKCSLIEWLMKNNLVEQDVGRYIKYHLTDSFASVLSQSMVRPSASSNAQVSDSSGGYESAESTDSFESAVSKLTPVKLSPVKLSASRLTSREDWQNAPAPEKVSRGQAAPQKREENAGVLAEKFKFSEINGIKTKDGNFSRNGNKSSRDGMALNPGIPVDDRRRREKQVSWNPVKQVENRGRCDDGMTINPGYPVDDRRRRDDQVSLNPVKQVEKGKRLDDGMTMNPIDYRRMRDDEMMLNPVKQVENGKKRNDGVALNTVKLMETQKKRYDVSSKNGEIVMTLHSPTGNVEGYISSYRDRYPTKGNSGYPALEKNRDIDDALQPGKASTSQREGTYQHSSAPTENIKHYSAGKSRGWNRHNSCGRGSTRGNSGYAALEKNRDIDDALPPAKEVKSHKKGMNQHYSPLAAHAKHRSDRADNVKINSGRIKFSEGHESGPGIKMAEAMKNNPSTNMSTCELMEERKCVKKTRPIVTRIAQTEPPTALTGAPNSEVSSEKMRTPKSRIGEVSDAWQVDQPRHCRILVRCRDEITPLLHLHKAPLSDEIRSVLRRTEMSIYPVTSYSLPAVLEGRNTAIISPAKSGKTLGYVLPILEHLQSVADGNKMPKGYGPLAIIVCAGSQSALQVFNTCRKYANLNCPYGMVKTRILLVHHGNEQSRWKELTEGCELLVTTPHSLNRILIGNSLTDLKRVRWLVLEQADRLLQPPFAEEINILRKKLKIGKEIQTVMTGEMLSVDMKHMLGSMDDYCLVFGCHLEAALYAKVVPSIMVTPKTDKLESLIGIVTPKLGSERIVIVCRITSEVKELETALAARGWNPLIAHSNMAHHIELYSVDVAWQANEFPLLVCSDSALLHLKVADATFIVHYSLPAKYKNTFGLRFSVLMDNYQNHFFPDKACVPLKSIVMVDEETQLQIPHMVEVFRRLGINVDSVLVNFSQKVNRRVELEKEEMSLCESLVSRGECPLGKSCPFRHAIVQELDSPDPRMAGRILFEPIHVRDGATIAARIIRADGPGGTHHAFPDHQTEIKNALDDCFKKRDRCGLGAVTLGALCAVRNREETFFRGKIELFCQLDVRGEPSVVRVQLIDVGQVLETKVADLFELPPEVATLPAQAVPIHIAGLLPCDFDDSWSFEAARILRATMETPLGKNDQWQGTVRVALRSGLVMDNVRVVKDLAEPHPDLSKDDLADKLIKEGVAVPCPEHIPRLLSLCQVAGISLSIPEKVLGNTNASEKPKAATHLSKPAWANFGQDTFVSVKFCYANDTASIFVQHKKFLDLLAIVEKECEKEGSKATALGKRFIAKSGDICLAKNDQGEWNRARVEDVEVDAAFCFFVDYGDAHLVPLKDMAPITNALVTQLPFQAIECSLGGVVHPEVCPQTFRDELDEFTGYGDENCLAKAQKQNCKPKMTGGPLYSINLMNEMGNSFNLLVVEKGLVSIAEDGAGFLETFAIQYEDEQDEIPARGEVVIQELDSTSTAEDLQVVSRPTAAENPSNGPKVDESQTEPERKQLEDGGSETSPAGVAHSAIVPTQLGGEISEDVISLKVAGSTEDLTKKMEESKPTCTANSTSTSQETTTRDILNEHSVAAADEETSMAVTTQLEGEISEDAAISLKAGGCFTEAVAEPTNATTNSTTTQETAAEDTLSMKHIVSEEKETVANEPRGDESDVAAVPLDEKDCASLVEKATVPNVKEIMEVNAEAMSSAPCGKVVESVKMMTPTRNLTPKILWQQDSYVIKLKIQVMGIKSKQVVGSMRFFGFRCTTEEGAVYSSSYELFALVDWKKARQKVTPFCLQIVLPKVFLGNWESLILTSERNHMIVPDPDGTFDAGEQTGRPASWKPTFTTVRADPDDDEIEILDETQ